MSETDREFLPLPYFPYDERPVTVPLDVEECATALYILRRGSYRRRRIG